MVKNLVIVESPAKAKTVGRFLGDTYKVIASVGHIRDLPKGFLGIDVKNNFSPLYEIAKDKRKIISEIKREAKKAEYIFLATDPDREGEAIAWHIVESAELRANSQLKRVVFHEITARAVKESFDHPRKLDQDLIDSQQARRLLDRLVGFKLSPLLWYKIRGGKRRRLSAGRVQSPAVGLIVDRENEIINFKNQEYWSINVILSTENKHDEFESTLFLLTSKNENIEITDNPTDIKKLSNNTRKTTKSTKFIDNEEEATKIRKELENASYTIKTITKKEERNSPRPPFITSTLQRTASSLLKFSPTRTMRIAQTLYEGVGIGIGVNTGLITYMRTDSTNMSESSLAESEKFIQEKYGENYTNGKRRYRTKNKTAQEAHEAIRPTSIFNTPDKISSFLDKGQHALYKLIWDKTVASQMADAIIDQTTVYIDAKRNNKTKYVLRCTGSVVKFDGHKILSSKDSDTSKELPDLSLDQKLDFKKVNASKKLTQPPSRYTEASLIRKLETEGIGRPSTYASIVQTIQNRDYAEIMDKREFHPTPTGKLVIKLLRDLFENKSPDVMNIKFTSDMEEQLDIIATGKQDWVEMLRSFYSPFDDIVEGGFDGNSGNIVSTDIFCEQENEFVIRVGPDGNEFLGCPEWPKCKTTITDLSNSDEKIKCDSINSNNLTPQKLSGILCEKGIELVIQTRRRDKKEFLGCPEYKKGCNTILNLPIDGEANKTIKCGSTNSNTQKPSGIVCDGGTELLIKKRKRDQKEFLSCSKFPKCRVAMPLPPEPNSDDKLTESWELSRVKAMKQCSELKVSGNGTSNTK